MVPSQFDTCIFCWKRKATEVFVKGKTRICKGCNYEIGRVLSFFEYMGYRMVPTTTDGDVQVAQPPLTPSRAKPKTRKPPKESPDGEGSPEDGAQQGHST